MPTSVVRTIIARIQQEEEFLSKRNGGHSQLDDHTSIAPRASHFAVLYGDETASSMPAQRVSSQQIGHFMTVIQADLSTTTDVDDKANTGDARIDRIINAYTNQSSLLDRQHLTDMLKFDLHA